MRERSSDRGLSSLAIGLIAYGGYLLGVAVVFFVRGHQILLPIEPYELNDALQHIFRAIIGSLLIAAIGSVIFLFLVSYLVLPFLLRWLTGSDRRMALW